MEDNLRLIVVVLFFLVGALREYARRKQKQQQQPPAPQQRPLPKPRVEDAGMRTQPRPQQPVQTSRTEEAAAAAMLPDELWELLTGQPKPKPTSPVPSAPAPDVEDEIVADEEVLIKEDTEVETRRRRSYDEAVSLEATPRRALPEVVSMEAPPPRPAVRHAAFHAKVDASSFPEISAPARPGLPELRRLSELRKALLAQAILGPPKALE